MLLSCRLRGWSREGSSSPPRPLSVSSGCGGREVVGLLREKCISTTGSVWRLQGSAVVGGRPLLCQPALVLHSQVLQMKRRGELQLCEHQLMRGQLNNTDRKEMLVGSFVTIKCDPWLYSRGCDRTEELETANGSDVGRTDRSRWRSVAASSVSPLGDEGHCQDRGSPQTLQGSCSGERTPGYRARSLARVSPCVSPYRGHFRSTLCKQPQWTHSMAHQIRSGWNCLLPVSWGEEMFAHVSSVGGHAASPGCVYCLKVIEHKDLWYLIVYKSNHFDWTALFQSSSALW